MSDSAREFSPEILQPLLAAGWTPERRVGIDHWLRQLLGEGNQVFPAATAFLENFGGIRLSAAPVTNRAFNPGKTVFDPIDAGSEIDRIQDWERDHALRLFPVGSAFNGHFVLLISDDGRFFAGNDESLVLVGNDLEQALRMLIYAPHHMPVLEP